jgi:hypothetical protein
VAVFVNQSAEDVDSLDVHAGIVTTGRFGAGQRWSLIKGSVRTAVVVVGLVFGQDGSKLPLGEDQYPV